MVNGYRRYRTGYVWQDLVDDDLLTPISDNEYVLKGSHKLRSPNSSVSSSYGTPTDLQFVFLHYFEFADVKNWG